MVGSHRQLSDHLLDRGKQRFTQGDRARDQTPRHCIREWSQKELNHCLLLQELGTVEGEDPTECVLGWILL